jgi:hypothetical protein
MESRPLPQHDDETIGPVSAPTDPPNGEETEGEFRLVVRKLELPVRPRGVLAE